MAFQYLTNVPLQQAKEEYLQLLIKNGLQPEEETVPVQEACGRITSQAVYAHICAPHYHASAMDGIALKASKTFAPVKPLPYIWQRRIILQLIPEILCRRAAMQ